MEPEAQNHVPPSAAGETVAIVSIAISLKRIADVMESLNKGDEQGRNLSEKIYYAILNPLSEAMAQMARHR